jgi:hypothetical protein
MQCTVRAQFTVLASTAEEAIAKAKMGEFEIDTATEDIIDWEVTGKPVENK